MPRSEIMKEYDEIWAVDAERIHSFFKDHKKDVKIVSLPERKLGSYTIPQTRIIITGENADELYHQFRLRFLTAGG